MRLLVELRRARHRVAVAVRAVPSAARAAVAAVRVVPRHPEIAAGRRARPVALQSSAPQRPLRRRAAQGLRVLRRRRHGSTLGGRGLGVPRAAGGAPSSHGGQTCPSLLLLRLLALELPPRTVLPPRVTAGAGAGSSSPRPSAAAPALPPPEPPRRPRRRRVAQPLRARERRGGAALAQPLRREVDFLVGAVGGGAAGGPRRAAAQRAARGGRRRGRRRRGRRWRPGWWRRRRRPRLCALGRHHREPPAASPRSRRRFPRDFGMVPAISQPIARKSSAHAGTRGLRNSARSAVVANGSTQVRAAGGRWRQSSHAAAPAAR